MNAPIVTFFNNKGGVGTTSLVYHVAWMLAETGHRMVAADLDPQANLTSAFLDESALEEVLRSFRTMSAFWSVLTDASRQHNAVGPSLGAINRAALVASDSIVVPVAPDLLSLQGLQNLGPALRDWRGGWQTRLANRPSAAADVPDGRMLVVGYVVLGHGVRLNRPVQAYQRWINQEAHSKPAPLTPFPQVGMPAATGAGWF